MKQRRMVSFDQKTDEYLQQYMKEQHVRFPGDAIARICLEHQTLKEEKQEKQKQTSPVPPVKEIVEVISERINRLMETERLFLRNEWFCMEESMKRSMMEIFQQVEEKKAVKRNEIVTAFLEGYNK
jgi:predicted nucleotide-binding protein (sugar kinase/HSP70/actin superfamily)